MLQTRTQKMGCDAQQIRRRMQRYRRDLCLIFRVPNLPVNLMFGAHERTCVCRSINLVALITFGYPLGAPVPDHLSQSAANFVHIHTSLPEMDTCCYASLHLLSMGLTCEFQFLRSLFAPHVKDYCYLQSLTLVELFC